jgi:hypothetical protein
VDNDGRRPEAILDIYNLLSALLLAFAHGAAGADEWLGGAVIAAVSLAALFVLPSKRSGSRSPQACFVLGCTHTTAMHVMVGTGFVVAVLAALDLRLTHYVEDRIAP